MLSKVLCFGIAGLEACPIAIETDIAAGLPSFTIVGLPDSALRESRERVRSAVKNSGFAFPCGRITINLSPADTRKEGPGFDLAIALGVLAAAGHVPAAALAPYAFWGELALDGNILPVAGTLSFALAAAGQCRGILVPAANAREAALAQTVAVYPVHHLKETVQFLSDPASLAPVQERPSLTPQTDFSMDFADVKGQMHAKRGLEVAAAGGHNVLLIGPPGSGKTMLAKRLAGILPDMSMQEILETTRVHSVAGLLNGRSIVERRPLRSPHHTCSDIALIGGGNPPKPGEVSFAHNGILFLDELPEFDRRALEVLRQPLEDHSVNVARALRTFNFPARFMLAAAMNPCPCGWRMGGKKSCSCSVLQVERYLSKISGPLLDRIDIHLEVPALKTNDLFAPVAAEPSAAIKQRTTAAREIQRRRFSGGNITANAQMWGRALKTYCSLNEEGKRLLKQAVDTLGLSGRAYDKVLKVARTIADLEKSESIAPSHLAEAIGYRSLDRN